MAKLTKKEVEKIEKQMTTNRRGDLWVGYRPVTFVSKKYNKKANRQSVRKEILKCEW